MSVRNSDTCGMNWACCILPCWVSRCRTGRCGCGPQPSLGSSHVLSWTAWAALVWARFCTFSALDPGGGPSGPLPSKPLVHAQPNFVGPGPGPAVFPLRQYPNSVCPPQAYYGHTGRVPSMPCARPSVLAGWMVPPHANRRSTPATGPEGPGDVTLLRARDGMMPCLHRCRRRTDGDAPGHRPVRHHCPRNVDPLPLRDHFPTIPFFPFPFCLACTNDGHGYKAHRNHDNNADPRPLFQFPSAMTTKGSSINKQRPRRQSRVSRSRMRKKHNLCSASSFWDTHPHRCLPRAPDRARVSFGHFSSSLAMAHRDETRAHRPHRP